MIKINKELKVKTPQRVVNVGSNTGGELLPLVEPLSKRE